MLECQLFLLTLLSLLQCVTLSAGVMNSVNSVCWLKRGLIYISLVDQKGSAENIYYFGYRCFWLVEKSYEIFFYSKPELCIKPDVHKPVFVIFSLNVLGRTSGSQHLYWYCYRCLILSTLHFSLNSFEMIKDISLGHLTWWHNGYKLD